MSLPVDERLLTAQVYLVKQRNLVLERKKELYEQFRTFALNKLITQGHPFKIKYRAINGDVKKGYKDLEMGEEFFLEYGCFTFDPKTSLLTDYVRTEFRESKRTDNFDELIVTSTKKPRIIRKTKQNLNIATDIERSKVEALIRKKVDNILIGIFKGELSFDDLAFKRLVASNIALEKELQELNTRISAVSIVNGGFGQQDNGKTM